MNDKISNVFDRRRELTAKLANEVEYLTDNRSSIKEDSVDVYYKLEDFIKQQYTIIKLTKFLLNSEEIALFDIFILKKELELEKKNFLALRKMQYDIMEISQNHVEE